jgi:hypothetical protein
MPPPLCQLKQLHEDLLARSCHKLRTVPAATLQRRPAGARRRRGAAAQGRTSCTMCAPAASSMEGTAPLLRGARLAAVRDGLPRGAAVAQTGSRPLARGVRASSGGVQASCLLRQVVVCAGADRCGVRCWAAGGGVCGCLARCRVTPHTALSAKI